MRNAIPFKILEVRLIGSVAFDLDGEGRVISKEPLSKCDIVVRISIRADILAECWCGSARRIVREVALAQTA